MNDFQAAYPIKPRELYRFRRAAQDVLMIALYRNKMNPAVLKSIVADDAVNAIITLLIHAQQTDQGQKSARRQVRRAKMAHVAQARASRVSSAAAKLKQNNVDEKANEVEQSVETCATSK
ncbi:hypothetical protein [Phyllobacterium meliloti]|uniref:hypothetical protein n=1 Tax=Phyllobacterium meliloti TaxID=555317 RepID=UPI000DDA76AD|nr:hypothetical protein [Phyllobacterium sp. T1293]UGX88301.1 hypothetical protein LLE53_019600 [Phyllobacterium sp. T1293]